MMFRKLTVLILCLICGLRLEAQELLCSVSIDASNIQNSDKQVFDEMQKSVMQYMNFRKWTGDNFQIHERIKCRIQFILLKQPEINNYEGSVLVQVLRPVYNTTYETMILNFQDKDVAFTYVPMQNLEFSDNTFIDNLTSVLNFYAYMILGVDYDCQKQGGGAEYFLKAQNIVNLAQNSQYSGWQSFGGTKNRYWLVENMLNNSYKSIHTIQYLYYRQGLDVMEKNLPQGRASVLSALKELQKLNASNPGLLFVRNFLDAKANEITNVFRSALPNEKADMLKIMQEIDPSGMSTYNKVNEGK